MMTFVSVDRVPPFQFSTFPLEIAHPNFRHGSNVMSDESRVCLFYIALRDGRWTKSVDFALAEVA